MRPAAAALSICTSRCGSAIKIMISPPRNNFPLKEDAELVVLLAGGIGITPIFCMIEAAERMGKREVGALLFLPLASATSRLSPPPNCRNTRKRPHFHFDDEAGGKFLQVAGEIVQKLP